MDSQTSERFDQQSDSTPHGQTKPARTFFYGWTIVGLALVVNALSSGPVWSGVGVWIKALELQFGWSRAQLTGAFSMAQLEGSIIGPLMGYLIDKLGSRRMVFIGMVITGLGFLLFSRTGSIFTFYLSYGMIMLGTAAGTWLPYMTVVNRWFVRKRGMAMAIAAEGSPLGGLVLVPILAWAVTPGNHGWSVTAQWIGVVFLCLAWPMSWLIRERPEDHGVLPDGDPPDQVVVEGSRPGRGVASSDLLQFTARQALRTHAFWLITFGHACSTILFATLTVHLVPMLTDQGLSLQEAAYVFSMVMGVAAVFQIVGGYVGDRIPINIAIAIFGFIQAGGFLIAVLVDSFPMAVLFAVVFGAGFGGRNPLTTAIRGNYFGKNAFATITGISSAPMYVFMLAAPLFAAFLFDATESYTVAFLIIGGLGMMSGVLFLMAKRPTSIPLDRRASATPRPTEFGSS